VQEKKKRPRPAEDSAAAETEQRSLAHYVDALNALQAMYQPDAMPFAPSDFVCEPSEDIKAVVHEHLPDHAELLKQKNAQPGFPHIVLICPAALRAADMVRQMRKLKTKVAKLFAKHFKLQDQIELLQQRWPVVVGTPNRLAKLAENGALSFTSTKLVLIDAGKNQKGFDIFELNDVKQDLVALLNQHCRTQQAPVRLAIVR
jgi:hypothetical protein